MHIYSIFGGNIVEIADIPQQLSITLLQSEASSPEQTTISDLDLVL